MWSSNVTQGENCNIHPTVEFFGRCILGNDVIIHAFTVIGGQPLSAKLEKKPFPHYVPRASRRPVIIEDKVVILNNATIQTGAHIKRGSIIGNHVHIGHDTKVGECCRIHVGSATAGHVTIGDRAILNPGVYVAEDKKIGAGARIGLGSTVIRDVPRQKVFFGVPARSQDEQRIRSSLMKKLLKECGRLEHSK